MSFHAIDRTEFDRLDREVSVTVPVVHVAKPGLLTTVQDRGRWGFQALGVSVAGPMDPVSHRLANAMAGNAADAATIEVTLVGPELVFEDERLVAVAGAEFEISVDDQPVRRGGPFVVPAGATLRFGRRVRGARAYLAVAGGVDTRPVLGSRATHLPSAMGGLGGRALAAGDRLPCGTARRPPPPAAAARRFPAAATALPDGGATASRPAGAAERPLHRGCTRRPAVGALPHRHRPPIAWGSG